jgi:hypothetical protein
MDQIKTARTAGVLYLAVTFLSLFTVFFAQSSLIVTGDAEATVANIMANKTLFSIGFLSDLLVQIIHIFLTIALYKLLKPVNKNQASLMAILALIPVPIAMLNVLNQIIPLILLSGAEYLAVFTAEQINALVLLFLNISRYGMFIAQIFWGLWLYPLGYLVYKSGYIPKIIGAMLIIGGFGYLIDFMIVFLLPSFDVTISMLTFWGEVILPLWLLLRGVKIQSSDDRSIDHRVSSESFSLNRRFKQLG